MRDIIIHKLEEMMREKQELNKVPAKPNEYELILAISQMAKTELDALIAEGCITVVGKKINKHRILNKSVHGYQTNN